MQFYGIELLHKIKAPKLDKWKFKYQYLLQKKFILNLEVLMFIFLLPAFQSSSFWLRSSGFLDLSYSILKAFLNHSQSLLKDFLKPSKSIHTVGLKNTLSCFNLQNFLLMPLFILIFYKYVLQIQSEVNFKSIVQKDGA